jgi:axial budding pattern protein 2
MPGWLSYDDKTGKLQGTPKDGDHAANITITFKDSFSDGLDVLVIVNVATGLFESTFEDMEIRPGGKFDLDLAKYFKDPSDVVVKVSTNPSQDWLKLSGLKLSSDVPKTSKGSFKLFIDASSKTSDLREKVAVNVSLLALDGTTTTVTSVSSTSAATNSVTGTGGANSDDKEAQPGHLNTGKILLAIIIPVLVVAILLMVLVCYFRRRRAGKSYLGSKYRTKISHPVASSLQVNSLHPSMREVASVEGFVHTETEVFKPAKAQFSDEISPASSQRRSSETLGGISASDMPPSVMVDAARRTTIRSVSNFASEDGRHSWVTIDGGHGGGIAPSDKSFRTQQSDATYSDGTRQLFPGANHGPRKDVGLEITLPTLNELPSVQPTPLLADEEASRPFSRHSIGGHSAKTSSSAALPTGPNDNYTTAPLRKWPTGSTTRFDASEANWVTLAESEAGESISELRKPDAVALRSTRPWNEADSSKSFATDLSFDSCENWRVIGRQSPTKTEKSYKELVDEIPFHLSRHCSTRQGAQPGERGPSPDPVSPIQWEDDVPSSFASGRIGSTVSKLSHMSSIRAEGVQMSGGRGRGDGLWTRDHSAKMSDGSYKVFI